MKILSFLGLDLYIFEICGENINLKHSVAHEEFQTESKLSAWTTRQFNKIENDISVVVKSCYLIIDIT